MSYHLTLIIISVAIRMAIIKQSTGNKEGERRSREKGTLLNCCWKGKLVQPLWKTVRRFLKKTKNRITVVVVISRQNYNSK